MYQIKVRNVNEALAVGFHLMSSDIYPVRKIAPRGKDTLEFPTPVCTEYTHPRERVLFNEERDANPFFHLMEGLWMLAGRSDVKWIGQFNSTFSQFSDDGTWFHGAYGYRLKYHFNIDQLAWAIRKLRADPDTRQVVLQIYDPAEDAEYNGKDTPCNTTIAFKIRDKKLNMTVFCRSNDMLWGAYGANAVHMSMIMEYVAGWVGVEMGTYYQISDSFHVYTDNPAWQRLLKKPPSYFNVYQDGPEPYHGMIVPMVTVPEEWDDDLQYFMGNTEAQSTMIHSFSSENQFFDYVAVPMRNAYWLYKRGQPDKAIQELMHWCKAVDWQTAGRAWIERRTIGKQHEER